MKTVQCDPALADRQSSAGAGQCWSSPQGTAEAASGDYPHGTIDECDDGAAGFRRVWHDGEAVWFNI